MTEPGVSYSALPPDPLDESGLAGLGARLRRGETSAEAVTAAYLERIARLEPKLDAFVQVAADRALEHARGIDRLLAAGADLGPLMGVPVVVKDLFTIGGFDPPAGGSALDIAHLIEPEGTFIRSLKRAGCVILGKTRTTEFALGAVNLTRRPPWNPWDAGTQRMPGGSSSGSAVALAAGLCAVAVGSDTGGSVRLPAALCGLFGYKPSPGLWPIDGVLPLAPTMDTIGVFTASAGDAALVYATLTGEPLPPARPLRGLRLGRPVDYFFDALHPEVERSVAGVLARLEAAGALLVPVEVPEVAEVDAAFARLVPAELLAGLGREQFLAGRHLMDPVARERLAGSLDLPATDYIRLLRRHREVCRLVQARMAGLDGWVTPTTPDPPTPVDDCTTPEAAAAWNRRALRNTRPANFFGQCGVSIPIPGRPGASLPVGLQVVCAAGEDRQLLSIAQGIEGVIGRAGRPDLAGFAGGAGSA